MTTNNNMVFCRGCGKEIHQTANACPNCGFVQNGSTAAVSGESGLVLDKIKVAVKSCLGQYATFSGRATRPEYWYFYLAVVAASVVAAIVDAVLHINLLNTLVQLGVMIPTMAVASRRLHDIGRSGWWQLVALTIVGVFVLIYWFAQKGSPEANRFGQPSQPAL